MEKETDIQMNSDDEIISIEERLKDRKPTCDGFYPHEILALSYAEKYTNKQKSFQVFWERQYGVNNCC